MATTLAQPADHAAREVFRKQLDRNFCVIAGAGSGKTTAIVDRIYELAATHPERLGQLVVVTYTKSAALEFHRRVRQRLLNSVDRWRLPEYLRALEQTFFGTIHSFCLSLLQEHRAVLELPFKMTLLEEPARDGLWETFVSETPLVAKLIEHPVTKNLLRVCSLQELLVAAKKMRPRPGVLPPADDFPLPDPEALLGISVPKNSQSTKSRTIAGVRRFVETMERPEGYALLPQSQSQYRPLLKEFERQVLPAVRWIEEAVNWAGNELALVFRQQYLRDGAMTYADQIDLCSRLLEHPEILEAIRARRLSIILDEAQDTDRGMFRILTEITRPPGEALGSWPGTGRGPVPGRFAMVGDPRQMIYARAGTEYLVELMEAFRQNDELLTLSVTHRCSQNVVGEVNRAFQALQVSGVPLDDLQAAAEATGGYVYRLPFVFAEDVDSVSEAFSSEAEAVASWVDQMGKSGLGIASWNELAIIAPRHAWLAAIGEAFKAKGIPYTYFKSRILRSSIPAYAWGVALLYTLLHPWDTFEYFGVLREIFGVPDPDLMRVAQNLGGQSAELNNARRALKEFDPAESTSNYLFFEAAIKQFRITERLLAIGESALPLDDLRFRAIDADQRGLTLREWLAELLDSLSGSGQTSFEAGDRVELITCHSAKGLEWEVVMPVGYSRKIRSPNDRYPRIVEDAARTRVVWNELSARNQDELESEREELQRLFYVTLTRARHGVIVPYPIAEFRSRATGMAFKEIVAADITSLEEPPAQLSSPRRPAEIAPEMPMPYVFSESKTSGAEVPTLVRPYALAGDSDVAEHLFSEEAGSYTYGRWWHTWVQNYPWNESPAARAAYVAREMPEERGRREIELFLHSADIQDLLDRGSWYSTEIPFSWDRRSDEWIEGVIDLVVRLRSGETWVIDWKTNQKFASESDADFGERLKANYDPQLMAYRRAIGDGFGVQIERTLIYSTLLGRFV